MRSYQVSGDVSVGRPLTCGVFTKGEEYAKLRSSNAVALTNAPAEMPIASLWNSIAACVRECTVRTEGVMEHYRLGPPLTAWYRKEAVGARPTAGTETLSPSVPRKHVRSQCMPLATERPPAAEIDLSNMEQQE